MVCSTCVPTSILGKTIKGRSTAGHDIRERPLVYSREIGQPLNGTMSYYPGVAGLSPEQQKFRHYGQFVNAPNSGGSALGDGVHVQGRTTLAWNWGSFIGGMIAMGVLILLFGTETGRGISRAAGQRVERKIRGW